MIGSVSDSRAHGELREPHRSVEPPALALCAHPDPARSRFSRPFLEALDGGIFAKKSLAEVYPDWNFDVEREQAELRTTRELIVVFPIYWYSPPAMLQKWFEDVFVDRDDFDQTTALTGYRVTFVVSTGGKQEEYEVGGKNGYDVETFLRPLETSFRYAGAHVLPPVVQYASWRLEDGDIRDFAARFNAEYTR
ncbi:MAG: NAD(P)H-dependent oxidoreductase [Salinarimonas sp.]